MDTPIYYCTKYGSIVERQVGPDKDGWMTVRRLSDNAIREWNLSELTALTTAEALAALATEAA